MHKSFDGLRTNLCDRLLLVHAACTGVRAITASCAGSVGTTTQVAAKLGDLVQSTFLFGTLAFSSAASGCFAKSLEHPVASKGPGRGLLWRRFVDIFSSVGGKEDCLQAEWDS